MISQYGQQLLNGSTCCHSVRLQKDGREFVGIYNGLANWGRIEDGEGNFVEKLDAGQDEEGSNYNFMVSDFEANGYQQIAG